MVLKVVSLLLLLYHCLPVQRVVTGQAPRVEILRTPNMDNINVLTNVTLTCTISPVPSQYFYFEWQSTSGLHHSRYKNTSTVEIPWFSHKHSGTYTCSVYIDNGSKIKESSVTLTATGAALAINYPYFRKLNNNENVDVKGRLRVYCYYTAPTTPTIGWYNNTNRAKILPETEKWELSAQVDGANRVVTMRTNEHYEFSLFHKGKYFCKTGLTEDLVISLEPTSSKPIIVNAKQGRYTYERPALRLPIECTTPNDYSPQPQFTWLFNGEDISKISVEGEPPFNITPYPLHWNFYQTRTESNLIFFNGEFVINGILQCVVSNALGRATADLLIEPKGPRQISRAAGFEEDVFLSVGYTLNLSVTASGTYKDIGWLLNGALFGVWLARNNSVRFYQCPDNKCVISNFGKTLSITSVAVQNTGTYQAKLFVDFEDCIEGDGSDCVGELESFNVAVYGPPEVYITREAGSPSSQLILTCHSMGNPPPKLQWKQNGTVVNSGGKFRIVLSGVTSRLTVYNPTLATFTCEGSNKNPRDPAAVTVTESDSYNYGISPGQPVVCMVSASSGSDTLGALGGVIAVMMIVMVFLLTMLSLIVCYFKRKGKYEDPYSNTTGNENDYITMTPAPLSATTLPLPSPPTPAVSTCPMGRTPETSVTYVSTGMISGSIIEEVNV